jgi:hypothetical protein
MAFSSRGRLMLTILNRWAKAESISNEGFQNTQIQNSTSLSRFPGNHVALSHKAPICIFYVVFTVHFDNIQQLNQQMHFIC